MSVNPNYSRDFVVFSFFSNETIAGVLIQKNEKGKEQPLAYALVIWINHSRMYIGYNKVIFYVPHSIVKDILSQWDCLGTQGKLVSRIQERDLEIKPTKLIKGQGLAQVMREGSEEALGMNNNAYSLVCATTK